MLAVCADIDIIAAAAPTTATADDCFVLRTALHCTSSANTQNIHAERERTSLSSLIHEDEDEIVHRSISMLGGERRGDFVNFICVSSRARTAAA